MVVRPSFTMGGAGSGMAYDEERPAPDRRPGLAASPTTEVLLEESILGWKEYELEVMRDRADNVVIVCSIENLDPMGVHTGDSITVVLVVRHPRAGAAHREDGRTTIGQPRSAERVEAVLEGVADHRAGHLPPPSYLHDVLERLTVLAAVDRLDAGADQLHAVLLEHAVVVSAIAAFSAFLAADGRSASGRSFSITFSTYSAAIGSMFASRPRTQGRS